MSGVSGVARYGSDFGSLNVAIIDLQDVPYATDLSTLICGALGIADGQVFLERSGYDAREVCEGRYLVLTHEGKRRDVAELIFPRIVEILAAK